MRIQEIYATYQGEVNVKGIGYPVIFIRTGGCHLRCYSETLGVLCDTPLALEKGSGEEMSMHDIFDKVTELSTAAGGIDLICLSGGDPIWRSQHDVHELLHHLTSHGYTVSVETSGTLSMRFFREIPNVYWVLDYKGKSAGIKNPFVSTDLPLLDEKDILKFVIYDEDDYKQFLDVAPGLFKTTKAKLAIGTYWGGKVKYATLIQWLIEDQMFGQVLINTQVHKMFTLYDATPEDYFKKVKIPEGI